MFEEYIIFFQFFLVAFVMTFLLLVIPFVLMSLNPDAEKLSSYECGFNSFEDASMRFEVSFFLVGILFVVFDLEIAYLFPFALTLTSTLCFWGFFAMFFFLIMLVLGFFYELSKGALDSM